MIIRRAEPRDIAAVAGFNRAMALETEGKVLDEGVVTRGVTHLLEQPAYGFYLVAADGERAIGCLMITYEWSDWRDGLFWWVQSVYVVPECRGQGVYRALYREAQRLAGESGNACGFRLYVEEHNHAAQATYERLGMHRTHYLMYEEEVADYSSTSRNSPTTA